MTTEEQAMTLRVAAQLALQTAQELLCLVTERIERGDLDSDELGVTLNLLHEAVQALCNARNLTRNLMEAAERLGAERDE